ncbi:putative membrane protein [Mucilaginibacter gossypiicola]|uniref:Putative membrane protein n=1 Tax=Mucilaginibacter gossypiicola TaxID=551995 RepID=A0A1H8B2M0_9SPHI|nr:bestrophin family ion channel [Mucilaginibacter gossypiicola]SEM76539.1 putative membrane protein [Mucilaginibacter gossypiicola]
MLLKKRISITYFLNLIKYDIIAVAAYAILAGTFDHYWLLKEVSIPLAVSAFVGTLLSLLLAFRTSQSYQLWWEARIIWGGIVNDSRTLIRQAKQFFPKTKDGEELVAKLAEQQILWCFALTENLRKVPFTGPVAEYVTVNQVKTNNLPNHLLDKHADLLANASEKFNINANKQVQIDSTIARLCDGMGKCERLKNTVFPRSYSVMIHFLIYVLMTLLPFGLEDKSKFIEICLTFAIPVLFIAIERTAILMQDPFENKPTDTPMTTLSRTIEGNLREMIGKPAAPVQPSQPEIYYIM